MTSPALETTNLPPSKTSLHKTAARQLTTLAVCLLLSLLVHASAAAPYLTWAFTEPPEVSGEGGPEDRAVGDGAVGDGAPMPAMQSPPVPVQISMYVEAAPAPIEPPPRPTTKTDPPQSASTQGSSQADRRGTEEVEKPGKPDNSGVAGSPAPGKKSACDPDDRIVKLGSHHWRIERDLVDYYASHLRELDRQASSSSHKNEAGKADGVLIYLTKCSILRHGGMRNGDIIHTVNGRKVTNIANAVTTYLALRKERNLTVEITRRNGKQVTHKYRLK